MSYIVRRVGGGTFNPNAMCVTHYGHMHLFVGCGTLINIYSLPDLRLVDQCNSHHARVTSLVCTKDCLISGDADGFILFHRFNLLQSEQSIIEKKVSEAYQHSEPIEKLLIRNDTLFYIYFKQRMFWVTEYSNNGGCNNNSIFIVNNQIQKRLCDLHDSLIHNEPTWLRFPALNNFDIDPTATKVIVSDECKLHIFDLYEKQCTDINLFNPARICRFRNNNDAFVFTQNGKFQQFGDHPFHDHWHYVCPNACVFDRTNVYSGGAEGVFLSLSQTTNRHNFLPRIGMTIEGMVMTDNSQYVAAVIDKNMLVVIDPKSNSLKQSLSHIVGDVFFGRNIITSLRRPNLLQFFSKSSGDCIDSLPVSSYNSRVPVTDFALTQDYVITVETADGKPNTNLSVALQAEFNHTKPHGNIAVSNEVYQNMLTKRRFDEVKKMLRMEYGTDTNENTKENNKESNKENNKESNKENNKDKDIPESVENAVEMEAIEGNPLVHDKDASNCVGYSEIKIWKHIEGNFQLEQSFRIVGKAVSPLSMHPVLPVYAMVVSKELQLWRHASDKWQLWKSRKLGATPDKLVWSPDGSVLALQNKNSIELFDVESFTVMFTKMFDSIIVSSCFLNDTEMIIHSKDSIATFDLRKLAVTKRIFAQAACCSASDNCISFVVNKNQPIVVLNVEGDMKCWQLPTSAHVSSLNVVRDPVKGVEVSAVDADNFIWLIYIEQFGRQESKENRITAITPVKKKEVKVLPRVDVGEDKTKHIMELVGVPSHQVPQIDDLCAAMFGLLIERRSEEKPTTVMVELDEKETENEVVDPVELSAQEMAKLRQFFAS
ncbi:hypothetical protein TRFO_17416 [Tritrichomonas foetus]|uniref:Anaphase-promoting complex subunit 4 WD40 domain-containing protein n=1 Tax=Tritrichomonas foetus TaxID=1144522 RepID=A0A1J4KN06_9EUKA|nr:hypothetical protein TRFO_17416 [Tritrichomonas foetus]|eukprot:OHT12697.1 hypothetical protein TRFO_17416 [Tritrichomonas foetus]